MLVLFITKISCLYFGEAKKKHHVVPQVPMMPQKAQVIAFILITNLDVSNLFMTLQNDMIMVTYITIGIYLFARNQPVWSCLFIALAYSVKAAALLILPAYLGCMMYSFGTKALVRSVAIIYGL